MSKKEIKHKKKIYYECKECEITYNTPCSVWVNEQGKPECTTCGRMLIRRVQHESA